MEKTADKVVGYPFVEHVNQELRPVMVEPVEILKKSFTRHHSSVRNLMDRGVILLMGYKYDFRPYLKKFLYNQYGMWHEAFAPSKTALRQAVYGRIDRIVDLPQK